MSGLFKFGAGSGQKPQLAGFRVQTSVAGLPIPLVYGTARIAGNLVDILDQKNSPTYSQPHRSKLGIGPSSQQTGFDYTAAVIIALCEGPIDGIANVWSDKSTAVTPPSLGFDVSHLGTLTQATWAYLSTNHPSDGHAIPYELIAYAAASGLDLPSNSLQNYTWEVQGLKRFLPGSGLIDAVGADILTDYLTDANHGVGWPAALLGSLTAYTDYCAAMGLFVSPVEDSQRAAADFLTELMQATNSALVWSDGVLKVIPYGDTAVTGNGHTYTPNTTPLYDLTDDDYLPNGSDDPVQVTRKKPSDRYNQVFVNYENRSNNYNPDVAEAKDQGAIDRIAAATGGNGLRPMPAVQLKQIKQSAIARVVAQLLLQREQYVCNTYAFRLGWRYSLLEPMDLVTLSDAGLGLSKTPVRITQIEELDQDAGLQVTAEDWPFGVASATRYATGSGTGFQPALNVDPGNTTAPVIFEGPSALQSSPLELWIAATGGANWGGCDVYISTDNVNFFKVGTIVNKATYGVLTAALASAGTTLSVDLTTSSGALVSYSATDYANLVPLCYVDGEFLAYETATLTSGFHYDLTTLTRGVYKSTIPASHAIGTNFVLCDGAVVRIPYAQGASGQTLHFKFPAFNVYGQALQDISTVTSVAHTLSRGPIVPGEIPSQFANVGQSVTYGAGATDDVAMSWAWNGKPGVTFDIYIEESTTLNAVGYPAVPTASVTHPTTFYHYTPVSDIDPVGTAGRKANIGFYVVARDGSSVLGQSVKSEVVYNRN